MHAMDPKATPLDCFYYWEKAQPDKRYFTQPLGDGRVREYSWREVGDEARRMAAHLQSMDLPPRSQIALVSKNCAHWIIADLAIWIAGHLSVPLYPTLNADTVQYILEHSESKLLFVGKLDDWDTMKPGVPADLPCIALPLAPPTDYLQWDDAISAVEPLSGETTRSPEEMATIVYTSGSTGRPKGVMQSFGAMAAASIGFADIMTLDNNERMLSYLPLAHVLERWVVEANSLRYGFEVFFAESLDTFVQDLRRAQPTIFASVPRLWSKFQAGVYDKLPEKKQKLLFRIPIVSRLIKRKILKQLGLEHVRYAATGSAPLSAETLSWYRSLGLELLEGYGMSENFGYSHGTRPGEARVGYVGHSNPGVETKIGDNGEILVRSPAMMMGYFKQPDKTAEDLTDDGFLKTGDMGEIDGQGRLKITGRVKELFKTSKGKYVAPVPLENKLVNHEAIEVVCVAGADQTSPFAMFMLCEEARAHLDKGERDQSGLEAEFSALLDKVNATVDPHEQVKFAVVVKDTWGIENGFLTPTMKIKRNVIESHYAPRVETWYAARKRVIWDAA